MGIIYKVTNLVNNKIYIGQTIRTLHKRKIQHIRDASFYKERNHIFHKSLLKYGIEQFEWSIIWEGDNNLLNDMEVYFIKKYNSFYKNNQGYNMTIGGDVHRGKDSFTYDLTTFNFYHISGIEELNITTYDLAMKYNLSLSNINSLKLDKIKSCKGWYKDKTLIPKLFSFYHEDGIKELNVSIQYMIKKYKLNRSNISNLFAKRLKTVSGWKLTPYPIYSFIHDSGCIEKDITLYAMITKYNLPTIYHIVKYPHKNKSAGNWKLLNP